MDLHISDWIDAPEQLEYILRRAPNVRRLGLGYVCKSPDESLEDTQWGVERFCVDDVDAPAGLYWLPRPKTGRTQIKLVWLPIKVYRKQVSTTASIADKHSTGKSQRPFCTAHETHACITLILCACTLLLLSYMWPNSTACTRCGRCGRCVPLMPCVCVPVLQMPRAAHV